MKNMSDAVKTYDVSLMINPDDVSPVTLILEGSNVGRGDKWYLLLNCNIDMPTVFLTIDCVKCPCVMYARCGTPSSYPLSTYIHRPTQMH